MKDFLSALKQSLKEKYTESEIQNFGFLTLGKITGFTRAEIIVNKDYKLTDEQQKLGAGYVEQLKNNVPIQYILGETEFYGLPFHVNASVLIPRPETEELVDWISSDFSYDDELQILDIGTGSGCIAVALKVIFQRAAVSAMDISEEALEVARENARLNNVDVSFTRNDILNPVDTGQKWDVIVSNPPYIPWMQKDGMDSNVVDFEPHTALFVPDDDSLLFYRKITEFAKKHLTEKGILYFEIHKSEAARCRQLLENAGYMNIVLRKDISGNDRMIRAELD